MASLNPHIIEDIKAVAKKLGQSVLSRAEYAQKGKFTLYQIYDGGTTWEQYCLAAGFATRKKEAVPDEVYFDRLRKAHGDLGPKGQNASSKFSGCEWWDATAYCQPPTAY